jgi:hypothetical protein
MSTSTSLTVATLCLIACFSFANAEYYRGEGTAYSGYREKDETGKNSCGFGKLDDRWERFYGKLRRRRLTDGLQGC